MFFNIPQVNDTIVLKKPWAFSVVNERRNDSLLKVLSGTGYAYHEKKIPPTPCELPAKTELKIERVYVRGAAGWYGNTDGAFDSITFRIIACSDKRFEKCRFWVKLADAHTADFDKGKSATAVRKAKKISPKRFREIAITWYVRVGEKLVSPFLPVAKKIVKITGIHFAKDGKPVPDVFGNVSLADLVASRLADGDYTMSRAIKTTEGLLRTFVLDVKAGVKPTSQGILFEGMLRHGLGVTVNVVVDENNEKFRWKWITLTKGADVVFETEKYDISPKPKAS